MVKILLPFILSILIAGCSSEQTQENKTTSTSVKSQQSVTTAPVPETPLASEQPTQPPRVEIVQVNNRVSLGDVPDEFVSIFGEYTGNNDFVTFGDGRVTVLLLHGRAIQIAFNFEIPNGERLSKEDAVKFVSEYLPSDSVKEGEIADGDYLATQYTSKLLVDSWESYFKAESTSDLVEKGKLGEFYVYLKSDEGGVHTAVMGVGVYQKKN